MKWLPFSRKKAKDTWGYYSQANDICEILDQAGHKFKNGFFEALAEATQGALDLQRVLSVIEQYKILVGIAMPWGTVVKP